MLEIIERFVFQLTLEEKKAVVEALKAAIAQDTAAAASGEIQMQCPGCGCLHTVVKGKDANGKPRRLCRGCKKTYSASTCSVLANSKLSPETWVLYAECMADALSLRESAQRTGVSLPTSWFMRMRLMEAMRMLFAEFRPASRVQIDSTYLSENLAGNYGKSTFSMPRKHHRNGEDVGVRGISNLKVCVMTAINEYSDCCLEAACRGRESAHETRSSLKGLLSAESIVKSDSHTSYPRALRELGVVAHEVIDSHNRSAGDINMVNALHSRLGSFLEPFHGVSTRRLQGYLDWFRYREQFRNVEADRRELLVEHALSGHYNNTRRALFAKPHLFMDYWEREMVA